jgi:hypothetical protein
MHRVRRKHQRLPPSLLIENASDRNPYSTPTVRPEAFPIKANDHLEVIAGGYFGVVDGGSRAQILWPASVYCPKKRTVAIAS